MHKQQWHVAASCALATSQSRQQEIAAAEFVNIPLLIRHCCCCCCAFVVAVAVAVVVLLLILVLIVVRVVLLFLFVFCFLPVAIEAHAKY